MTLTTHGLGFFGARFWSNLQHFNDSCWCSKDLNFKVMSGIGNTISSEETNKSLCSIQNMCLKMGKAHDDFRLSLKNNSNRKKINQKQSESFWQQFLLLAIVTFT